MMGRLRRGRPARTFLKTMVKQFVRWWIIQCERQWPKRGNRFSQIQPEGRRTLLRALSVAALLLATFTYSRSWAEFGPLLICEREMTRAAKKYRRASGRALCRRAHRDGTARIAASLRAQHRRTVLFPTRSKTPERFDAARRAGIKLIDIGCMQINQYYHGSHFRCVADMFDPHENVEYAAHYLKDLRVKEGSWTLAAAATMRGRTTTRRKSNMSAP